LAGFATGHARTAANAWLCRSGTQVADRAGKFDNNRAKAGKPTVSAHFLGVIGWWFNPFSKRQAPFRLA
jgi:hypothetical protein